MTGFLCLYKKPGISSFGALAELRRLTGEKKIGHCGTLDPMATGVLPAAFGRAAKFIEFLPDQTKAYTAEFRLGIETDTLDITGRVMCESAVHVSPTDVINCLSHFEGEQLQTPPMYSAVSKNGVRLYELARQGIVTEREKRKITISSVEYLGNPAEDTYRIHVKCSKGTYIRSLIGDIGAFLGCGAVMTSLERCESNGFTLEQAIRAEDVASAMENGTAESLFVSVEKVLSVYPALTVTAAQHFRFRNGGELDLSRLPELKDGILHRVYTPDGRFFALGERADDEGVLKMRKLYEISD